MQNLLFGIHTIEALLNKNPERMVRLYIQTGRQDQRIQQLLQLAKAKNIPHEIVDKHRLDRMTQEAAHQGVVAECHPTEVYSEADLFSLLSTLTTPAFLLILDNVQDPHNLGACLRSANAAGVHAVIAPKDKSVGLTPTVCKVASGAAETIPFVQVTNLARTMELLKEQGVWLFGADAEASQSLYQADFKGAVAMVLGAEGTGLRRLTRESCDVLLKIPMQGTVSSLNVSAAASIFLFEVVRQRS